MTLRNPLMLASGVLDESYESMKKIWNSGAGAVITKSIGKTARAGYPNPVVVNEDGYLINAMGLPNPGIDDFINIIEKLNNEKIKVITSIFAENGDDFSYLAKKAEQYSTAIELNLSCPHAKGLGAEIGSNADNVYDIVKSVKSSVKIPVWAKLTPNIADVSEIGIAAEEGGADAVVAINTVRAMAIDIKIKKPVLSNRYGGMSGKAIKPVGIAAVYKLYESVKIPVIGVGGIESFEDVVEYMMAGACSVEIGTAIARFGVNLFNKILTELQIYMKENEYDSPREMVGVAHING